MAIVKPPYRIPPLAEILNAPSNGLVAVSTFSGCGGSCLGLRWAGYRVAWANEFVPAARETYLANFPGATVDHRDIRTVQAEEILAATGLLEGELDLLEGSPPCQSFSMSGRRHKGWGKVSAHADGSTQRSDDLFLEFDRLLGGLRPRAFWAENVTGLVKGAAVGFFNDVMARLKDRGYRVAARLLDAQWLGVPQRRVRVFIVGVRDDLGLDPSFPDPLPYQYSLRDAIPSAISHSVSPGFQDLHKVGRDPRKFMRDSKSNVGETVLSSVNDVRVWVIEDECWLTGNIKKKAAELPEGGQHHKSFNLVRPRANQPCPTLLAMWGHAVNCVVHPTEPRKFSIAELRRVCGFPDDFVLIGSYAEQWARLGNSVAPPVARAMAETLANILNQTTTPPASAAAKAQA